MKRILLQFSVLLFAATFSMAQNQNETTTTPVNEPPNPNTPVIEFEKTVYDFGNFPFDGDGSCSFLFKNTGIDPLVINNAKASCGCTVPNWPKQPILKGQQDTIHVKYNTKRQGQFTKTITISSNAKTPQVTLTIKGTVGQQPGQDANKNEAAPKVDPVKQPEGPVQKNNNMLK
ncbi:MAG: DUF1573 domain-containing protein [Bacteroidia bacterium]|nr:DUF1573 domain-containing protein [Bacteroidia bacterium]